MTARTSLERAASVRHVAGCRLCRTLLEHSPRRRDRMLIETAEREVADRDPLEAGALAMASGWVSASRADAWITPENGHPRKRSA